MIRSCDGFFRVMSNEYIWWGWGTGHVFNRALAMDVWRANDVAGFWKEIRLVILRVSLFLRQSWKNWLSKEEVGKSCSEKLDYHNQSQC